MARGVVYLGSCWEVRSAVGGEIRAVVVAVCQAYVKEVSVMAQRSLGARRHGWQRPVAVPESLSQLRGELSGRVRLPITVYGSGPVREFDLSSETDRIELYPIVMSDGRIQDVVDLLNATELVRLLPQLWLSPHVRRAWEPLLAVTTP